MTTLHEYLRQNDLTLTVAAAQLGISIGALSRILHGLRKPSPALAKHISSVTGVPLSALRPDIWEDEDSLI